MFKGCMTNYLHKKKWSMTEAADIVDASILKYISLHSPATANYHMVTWHSSARQGGAEAPCLCLPSPIPLYLKAKEPRHHPRRFFTSLTRERVGERGRGREREREREREWERERAALLFKRHRFPHSRPWREWKTRGTGRKKDRERSKDKKRKDKLTEIEKCSSCF